MFGLNTQVASYYYCCCCLSVHLYLLQWCGVFSVSTCQHIYNWLQGVYIYLSVYVSYSRQASQGALASLWWRVAVICFVLLTRVFLSLPCVDSVTTLVDDGIGIKKYWKFWRKNNDTWNPKVICTSWRRENSDPPRHYYMAYIILHQRPCNKVIKSHEQCWNSTVTGIQSSIG